MSRDGLRLGCIGAPGYRAHSSVAMAPMFKGIRFGSVLKGKKGKNNCVVCFGLKSVDS